MLSTNDKIKENKKILFEGFTLIEMITSILISASVFTFLFSIFNQINMQMKLEENEFEINGYANLILDEIAYTLSKCNELTYETRLDKTTITTENPSYNNSNILDRNIMIVDLKRGFSKNDSLRPGYQPNELLVDGTLSTKYNLHNFRVEDVGFALGDIYSTEAQNARNASRNLHLEVLLFTKTNQNIPYDTLKYDRRVFCPGLLVAEGS